MKTGFLNELCALINRYSLESDSNTPDHVLTRYLKDCLIAYENAIKQRDIAISGALMTKKSIVVTQGEMNDMLTSTAEYVSNRVLERHGHMSILISRQAIINQIGIYRTNEAFRKGYLVPIEEQSIKCKKITKIKNKGRGVKIYCLRSDFDKYLLSFGKTQLNLGAKTVNRETVNRG